MHILKEKFEKEKEFWKDEMELKKKEQENKAAQYQMLIDQQRQNKQQYQDVMNMMAKHSAAEAGTTATKLSNAFPAAATTTESNVNEFTWKSIAQILITAGKGKTKVENQTVNLWPFQPFRAMLLLSLFLTDYFPTIILSLFFLVTLPVQLGD